MKCTDLRRIAQERRWKWRYDDPGMTGNSEDSIWHVEILCRYGVIYPIGKDFLGVCVEGHPNLPSKLMAAGCKLHQGRVVFSFTADLLNAVAEIMRPRRKRPAPTPDVIAKGMAALAKSRNTPVQSGFRAPESTQAPSPLSPPLARPM